MGDKVTYTDSYFGPATSPDDDGDTPPAAEPDAAVTRQCVICWQSPASVFRAEDGQWFCDEHTPAPVAPDQTGVRDHARSLVIGILNAYGLGLKECRHQYADMVIAALEQTGHLTPAPAAGDMVMVSRDLIDGICANAMDGHKLDQDEIDELLAALGGSRQ